MTRTYALRCLLEHGPLTFAQALEVTGWPVPTLWSAIRRLLRAQVIRVLNMAGHRPRRRFYALAS